MTSQASTSLDIICGHFFLVTEKRAYNVVPPHYGFLYEGRTCVTLLGPVDDLRERVGDTVRLPDSREVPLQGVVDGVLTPKTCYSSSMEKFLNVLGSWVVEEVAPVRRLKWVASTSVPRLHDCTLAPCEVAPPSASADVPAFYNGDTAYFAGKDGVLLSRKLGGEASPVDGLPERVTSSSGEGFPGVLAAELLRRSPPVTWLWGDGGSYYVAADGGVYFVRPDLPLPVRSTRWGPLHDASGVAVDAASVTPKAPVHEKFRSASDTSVTVHFNAFYGSFVVVSTSTGEASFEKTLGFPVVDDAGAEVSPARVVVRSGVPTTSEKIFFDAYPDVARRRFKVAGNSVDVEVLAEGVWKKEKTTTREALPPILYTYRRKVYRSSI